MERFVEGEQRGIEGAHVEPQRTDTLRKLRLIEVDIGQLQHQPTQHRPGSFGVGLQRDFKRRVQQCLRPLEISAEIGIGGGIHQGLPRLAVRQSCGGSNARQAEQSDNG